MREMAQIRHTGGNLGGLLASLTETWKHPLCRLALARAAGGDAKRHPAVIERYGSA